MTFIGLGRRWRGEIGCGCIVGMVKRGRNKKEREELEKMGKKNKTCFLE